LNAVINIKNMTFKVFKKVNFRGILLIVFIVLVISVIQLLANGKRIVNNIKKRNTQPVALITNTPLKKETPKYHTGLIFTSGLSEEEKKTFSLNSKYQLEKGRVFEGDWQGDITGYFLEAQDEDIAKYLGSCVRVYGDIKKGWENLAKNNYEFNGVWSYYRSALVLDKIEETDMTNCVNDFDVRVEDSTQLETMKSEYKKLTGVLKFADNRPAPDIAYDYTLQLSNPFYDSLNPVGESYLKRQLDVLESTNDITMSFLDNIGKKVEVEGYMGWGYNETRDFTVYSIKPI
jgi:hypothetical protein